MLGGYRDSIATSITISIIPLCETIELASEYLQRGFTIIKVKGGTSKEEDIEKILTIREKCGNDFSLRFDANQSYSFDESIDFIEKTKSAHIEIFEQPIRGTAEGSVLGVWNFVCTMHSFKISPCQ